MMQSNNSNKKPKSRALPPQHPQIPNPEDFNPNLGSGVIVSTEGLILTNEHVIEGADVIEVAFADGRKTTATLIGSDPDTDLAVLRVQIPNLPKPITFGKIESVKVGDVVLAIGNPFGVGQTVTSGIALHWAEITWASTPLKTSSKPMRPSILATLAAPWLTPEDISLASTPLFTLEVVVRWELALLYQ
jgi:S1-C subfamily serine protease